MGRRLSSSNIESWCGNVLPLRLLGGMEYGNEPITWHSDAPCVRVTSYAQEEGCFTDGVMLTLLTTGQATVTATLGDKCWCCRVTVRERKKAMSGKELHYYTGDFHNHTFKSHKKEELCSRNYDYPLDLIEKFKKDGALDFAVISDHADLLNAREYYRGYADAETAQPMELVMFPGSEAEVTALEKDRYDVVHKNSGEIVTVNAAGFAAVDSWEEFNEKYKGSPFAISALAHPQTAGFSTPGIWNFCLDKNSTPRLKEMVKLVEMGNGGDRECNLLHEYVYSLALDNGFRVSVTCASDAHGSDYDIKSFPGRTVIMAPEKSKEAFADAIWNNRVYATSSGNVKLFYSVNGMAAPAELPLAGSYSFHVELSCFREEAETMPVVCQVISDYGKCVKEIRGEDLSTFDFTVESDTARYFYLRLLDREGRKTWSCPVFTGRPCDGPGREEYIPISKAGFTAVDTASGRDAAKLINDDPADPWISEGTACSILIDMQEEKAVSALGHYPRILELVKLRQAGIDVQDKTSEFPSGYRLSTSCDGKAFTCRAEGLFRVFGGEELIRFEPHTARYIKLEILTTCGAASGRARFRGAKITIGELTVYKA